MTDEMNNGGMSWIWILLIFFLLFRGGDAFGGGVAANPATNLLNNDFLFTQQKIDTINANMNAGFNGVNAGITSLGYNTQLGFASVGAQIANCCCETNRNIDSVRYEAAQNTAKIIESQCANTQRIVDTITANEIQGLRDRLTDAQIANSNFQQNQYLVNALRPSPVPAYSIAPTVPFGYPPAPFGYNGCNPCGC